MKCENIFWMWEIANSILYFSLTLLAKKTLFWEFWLFGWIHESQIKCRGPLEKPSRTMVFRNTSLQSSFCTKTAPTFPKDAANSNLISYCTSSSFVPLFCTLLSVVFLSEFVSSFRVTKCKTLISRLTNIWEMDCKF